MNPPSPTIPPLDPLHRPSHHPPLPYRKHTREPSTTASSSTSKSSTAPSETRPSPKKPRDEASAKAREKEREIFSQGLTPDSADHALIDSFLNPSATLALSPAKVYAHAQRVHAATEARTSITEDALAATGILASGYEFNNIDMEEGEVDIIPATTARKIHRERFDFFASLSTASEMFGEIAKFLSPTSLLSLYAISRDFHATINANISSILRACALYQAPESARLFMFRFYGDLCITDPVGRLHPRPERAANGEVRLVPSIRWLSMVVHREKAVRDILACLAREGHRCPKGMGKSLKKMWLVMDVATSAGRARLMHKGEGCLITDMDLWNWQFFMVKLDMRFNDPIDGPGDDGLRKLMLGQRGLSPLWRLLRRDEFLSTMDVVRRMVRYRYDVRPQHLHLPIFGIPPEEIGIAHLEGWGRGRVHLMRPDELVIWESVRRKLGLKHHIMEMMLWGYVDPITGLDTPATEEEKYMSDDEEGKVDPYWCDYEERDSDVEYVEDPEAVDSAVNNPGGFVRRSAGEGFEDE